MRPRLNVSTAGTIAAIVFTAAFLLYLVTLAPGVISLNDDTLEFQLVAVRGAITHPTGYPILAMLLTLWARIVPLGEMAWRANLLSALCAALAISFTYLAARRLLNPPMLHIAALTAAVLFSLTPTFWAQATVAEVYALHFLLMAALVWRVLVWLDHEMPDPLPPDILLLMGLGLAHHRTIVLWFPAILVIWALTRYRRVIPLPTTRQVVIGFLALLLPLLSYLWLPLRSAVGSIDGSYQQVGFGCWVTACQYAAFFSENPLEQQRSPLFFAQQAQWELGWIALLLVILGTLWVVRQPGAKFAFFGLGLLIHVIFAQLYRVPDPEVFGMPILWILALLSGAGLAALARALDSVTDPLFQRRIPGFSGFGIVSVAALALFLMGSQGISGWQVGNRSELLGHPRLNGIPFNGHDILNQPLPSNAVVVGLLGEITYLRYLQEAGGIAPLIQTAGGDDPTQRLAAIEAALLVGSRPFLTRELAGLEHRYSLSSLGPLIEVFPSPRTGIPEGLTPVEQRVTDSITLAGWTRSPIATSENVRLTVAWRVTGPIVNNLHVSARLVTAADIPACQTCQVDRPPVRNAYATSAWRESEVILDTYELPAPPAGSHYLLIFYLPETGAEVGRATIFP